MMIKDEILKVKKLRKEGYSYNQIALKLGYTKSQICYANKIDIENLVEKEKRQILYEEDICNLAKSGNSLTKICKINNKLPTNTNLEYFKKILEKHNIIINENIKTIHNTNNFERKNINEYLKYGSTIGTSKLKNLLIKNGYKAEKCEKCENTEWLGKKIPLQLHHIDGDRKNNKLENLQLLCPNCHSLTDNFCGKNKTSKKSEKETINKIKLPKISKDEIIEAFKKYGSFTKVGKMFNVSDKTIVKWCYKYNLPTKSLDFRKYINDKFGKQNWHITNGNPNAFKKEK